MIERKWVKSACTVYSARRFLLYKHMLRLPKYILSRLESQLLSPRFAFLIGEPIFHLMGMRPRKVDLALEVTKKVLIVRLDEIGDVVLTTPFLREFRKNLPRAWITLVVKPSVFNLVELCPYVNEVLTYDWSKKNGSSVWRRHWRALKLSRRHFWKRRFDLAIVPRWDVDYYHASFVAYFSGAPRRVGYSENCTDLKKTYNKGYDELYTDIISETTQQHEVEISLDILRLIGGVAHDDQLELWTEDKDEKYAEHLLAARMNSIDYPIIAMGIGAGSKKRIWPSDRYRELALWLNERYNAIIVLCGSSDDVENASVIENQLGSLIINLIGKTTLLQMAAIMKRCRLYVGNDAGPMHIAAAVGVPIVEISCHPITGSIYHYNSPVRFGPWDVPCRILQPKKTVVPCVNGCEAESPHCILDVTVDNVREAVSSLLAKIGKR